MSRALSHRFGPKPSGNLDRTIDQSVARQAAAPPGMHGRGSRVSKRRLRISKHGNISVSVRAGILPLFRRHGASCGDDDADLRAQPNPAQREYPLCARLHAAPCDAWAIDSDRCCGLCVASARRPWLACVRSSRMGCSERGSRSAGRDPSRAGPRLRWEDYPAPRECGRLSGSGIRACQVPRMAGKRHGDPASY